MARRRRGRPQNSHGSPAMPFDTESRFRVAAGLGDAERERMLLSSLQADDDITVVERCLSADQLLAGANRGEADVIFVGSDLHRLTDSRLEELVRTRIPLVLLARDADEERWESFPGAVLPIDAEAEVVRQTLVAVIQGERPRPSARHPQIDHEADEAPEFVETSETVLSTIAVAGGHGSPGRTTVALALAATLGAVAPTVLVDADLSGSSLAACLDADPTRNLSMLVYAEPETPHDWDRAIAQEVQPLHVRSPHSVVLCGVAKPEMAPAIPVRFFEQLVAELEQRYRYVILDVGADLLGPGTAVHRAALALSQQILFVTASNMVGLWHARVALGLLHSQVDAPSERLALVINRHDRRHHHGRSEIEWALGVAAAAIVPHDHSAVQRALGVQHPVIFEHRSRAGRALIDLAERAHGGHILLPPEARETKRRRWLPRMHAPGILWRRRAADKSGV